MKNTIETKVCTKCGEDKPLSEYHKKKSSKDGHRNDCKACVRSYTKKYNEANKERIRARDKDYYQANRDERVRYQREYYAENREARNAASRADYAANRDKYIAYSKARYEANHEAEVAYRRAHYAENREDAIARQRAYYTENREEVLERTRELRSERYATDPEYRAKRDAANTKRQRLLEGAKQEPYLREDIFERDNWTCGICQEPIDPELKWPERGFASIDHIVPISHGGDDAPDNVQAAHLSCNTAKGNRVELEDLQAA